MICFVLVAALAFCAGVGWARTRREARYATPNLHEGVWVGPSVDGRQGQVRVVWTSVGGHTICTGSNHGAKVCTVGPGMAHVDTCDCGAERYGVYGTWS